jgi:hypothetical protein
MGTHVRRFVRSAWLLLFVQFFAALIALSATGWAAFYVADLRAERDSLRAQVAEFTGDGLTEPAYQQPQSEEVELLDESVFDDGPEDVAEATDQTDPPVTTTPPTRTTNRPTTRTAVRTPDRTTNRATRQDASERTTETAPPRRNTTYPGGLPGQGNDNSEPPFILGRIRGDTGQGTTQTEPGGINIRDVADEIGRDAQGNPNQTQNPNYPNN